MPAARLVLLLALIVFAASAKYHLAEVEGVQEKEHHFQLQNLGYWVQYGDLNWGIAFDINFDVGGNYRWIWGSVGSRLLTNPIINLLIGGRNTIQLNLYYFKPKIILDLDFYKFTPFDFQFLLDIQYWDNYCYGMSWLSDVLNFNLKYGIWINECVYGMFGIITGDYEDCEWWYYEIEKPLFGLSAFDEADQTEDFVPFNCYPIEV